MKIILFNRLQASVWRISDSELLWTCSNDENLNGITPPMSCRPLVVSDHLWCGYAQGGVVCWSLSDGELDGAAFNR